MDFQQDTAFLAKVNQNKVKEYWAAIMILDFQTEKPLARIEGKVVGGNISIAAKSTTRRTGSLNLVFDSTTKNITNVNNLIAIDKKVAISIGMTNPYYQSSIDEYNQLYERRFRLMKELEKENDEWLKQYQLQLQSELEEKFLAQNGRPPDDAEFSSQIQPQINSLTMDMITKKRTQIERQLELLDIQMQDAQKYIEYGDILWYKQGVFVITKANSTVNTTSSSVAINFVDKMAYLNGTCGGTLSSAVSFHDIIIIDKDGNTTTDYPLISTIIRECVQHYGGEHPSRIVISDIEDVGRQVVRYQGSTPIHFFTNFGDIPPEQSTSPKGNYVIQDARPEGYNKTFHKGDICGYLETPLTYPGELVMGIGSTVTRVLDEIVKTLGNYEYFYDVDGVFHFQKIKNYLYTGDTPLNYGQYEIAGEGNNPATVGFDDRIQQFYLPQFQPDAFLNEFADTSLVTSVNFNPNYENIKNDFVVWGTRDSNEEASQKVRYHLAIDKRPKEEFDADGNSTSLCNQHIYAVILPYEKSEQDKTDEDGHETLPEVDDTTIQSETEGQIVKYQLSAYFPDPNNVGYRVRHVCRPLKDSFPDLGHEYWYNWREELYRMALLNYGASTDVEQVTDGAIRNMGEQYFEELRAEWRNVFDPESTVQNLGPNSFQKGWNDYYGTNNDHPWYGYNVNVALDPSKIRYWLDLLDTDSTIGQFSVDRIGRRTVAQDNSKINEVFSKEVFDMVFIDTSNQDWKYKEQLNGEGIKGRIQYYNKIGQAYCLVPQTQISLFQKINSYGTCFDSIRDLLYNHLIYQSAVTLTSIPLFYMDVNKIVRLNFPDKGIAGDYVINTISYSLGATATMNLQLQEAMVIN